MAGRHHWYNEHELGQTPGDGEGQGGLVCCSPWGCKELDTTGQLNNNSVVTLAFWDHKESSYTSQVSTHSRKKHQPCGYGCNRCQCVSAPNLNYPGLPLKNIHICLFVCLLLCWVFVAVGRIFTSCRELGLLSSHHAWASRCNDFSWAQALGCAGFSSCGSWAYCPAACWIFPDQGSNLRPLHWQVDSSALTHQESPAQAFLNISPKHE